MTVTFGQVLILIAMSMAFGLSTGALCAYAVFRTKREPHETMFGKAPEGDVFSIDNFGEEEFLGLEGDTAPPQPENITRRHSAFMEQYEGAGAEIAAGLGSDLGGTVGGKL